MSGERAIAEYTRTEYDALRQRLGVARDTLRAGNSLLQSAARAYYVVYVVASDAAGQRRVEVTHWRSGKLKSEMHFSHYCSLRREAGVPQGRRALPGAYRSGLCPSAFAEPYTADEVDRLLQTAKCLIEDLERLI